MSASTVPAPVPLPSGRARALSRVRALARERPELLALLVLAAVLNLWALDRNGWANEYYAAAVRSMSTSWHTFLYGSFDASGVMTVDKPPLALWVQALSARAFGFSSWSILVPQALMGVGAVALTYDLVRRRFGRAGGFAAGLVLALTPVTVAISRHNNPDALLVLCCVAALWALVRGLEDGRLRWVVLAGVCVGLGFEAKMLVALMVVPGIAAAWLWIAPRGRLVAIKQLLAGGAGMVVVALAWPLLMWLTPASSRPWVSGTADNSIWSLITGYNGFGRILGQSGGPGGGGGGPGGGGGGFFGGSTGPFRLLNDALGGQAGWLLGFAVVAIAGLAIATRLKRTDARSGWLLAVGGAFLVTAIAFSKASGIFHPYYVSLLAPFTAALVGAGVGEALRGERTMLLAFPLAIAAAVITELVVLHDNPGELGWVTPLLVTAALGAGVAAWGLFQGRTRTLTLATAAAVLLIAPGAWAFQTLGHATSGTFPAGGPTSTGGGFGGPGGGGGFGGRPGGFRQNGGPPAGQGNGGFGAPPAGGQGGFARPGGGGGGGNGFGGGGFGGNTQSLTEAVTYAKSHGGGAVAVASQSGAAGSLITSGADVVAIGGFSGRESQVSVDWLADAVAAGKLRWILTDGGGFGGGFGGDDRIGASDVMAVVQRVGKEVSSVSGLYDLQGLATQLRAANA